jgi:hypothetical protein
MAKSQRNREKKLIRRLVEGVAGWLTYKQASGSRTLFGEHFLYPPIYDIALGRGWSVLAQEAIDSKVPKTGARSTIDFVFSEAPQNSEGSSALIMMEVKYLRGGNTTVELRGLHDDFMKLRATSQNDLDNAKSLTACGTPGKWQLIIAEREAYNTLSTCKSKEYPELVKLLKQASSSSPPSLIYRSVIETRLKARFHWHVLAISEKRWPVSSVPR